MRRAATRDPGGPVVWALRALACVLPLAVLRLMLSPVLGGAGGLTLFLPAVLLSTLWGGWRSGLAAVALSFAVGSAATLIPGSLPIDWFRYWVGVGLFAVNVAVTVVVAQALRNSIRAVDQARQAEQARAAEIAESESRFRGFAENAPVMLWMGDPLGRCVHLNRALREFWGVPEGAGDFDWSQALHPDDHRKMFAVAGPATARGEPFDVEARFRRADGAWRIMTTHAQPRYDDAGRYQGMIGVNVDVTEAREAEAALRESEARFRAMADSAPAPIWITDTDSQLLFGNRALVAMLGGDDDPESVLGRAWMDRVHPDDWPAVWEAREAAHPKREPYGWEARFKDAGGGWVWIRATTTPRFDEQGTFLGYVGIGFDITAAHEAEAALRESEARFRAMADSAPAPVWISGPRGGIEFGNQALQEFVGDEAKARGVGWMDLLHPDDREAAIAVRDEAMREHRPFTFEARFRNAEGLWRWMRATTRPRLGPGGEFLGYIGIAFDVTDIHAGERRHAFLLELGDALRDLEDPRAIMDAATEALGRNLEVPRVGYGEVNEAETHVSMGADWTDGSMASASGVYLMDDFGPELSRDLKARKTVAVSDVSADPRTADAAEGFSRIGVKAFVRVPIVRSGRLQAFLFLHSHTPRVWAPDEVDLAEEVADRVWIAVERAAAEAEVRESEARFRSVADSAPVLIWVTRADRRRAFINQAYVEFHGGTYEEALNADWRVALHPEDVDRIISESLAGEASRQPFMLEARYRRQDGAWRWLRSYSRPRFDGQGELMGFVGVAYDVTEAKQVERDLTHINELLEARVAEALAEKERVEAALMHVQKMEAVGRLTGGVAHDFNNLLTVVIGALDMASRASGDSARRDRLIEAALAAARRGERLTHQLLAFSRKQALRPQVSDLNTLIMEGEPLLRRAVGEAVELKVDLASDLPAVSVDPAHFEAALLNLVVNARDATPDGGSIRISTEAVRLAAGEVDGAVEGEHIVVRVADTGAGMSPEVRERAFEPFFTTKAVGKGTGLGLSQVYGFMRQSGGAVVVDSAPGEGATISLYLPAVAGTPSEAAGLSPPPMVADDKPFSGYSVLLVEDDPEVSDIASAFLEHLGLTVVRAEDGPKALRKIKGRRFDLLLTDLVMPGGMNGVDLARKVVERQPDIAVLLSSGYAGEAVDRALSDAPWPLLSKPYDAEAMRRAVTGALSQARPA